MSSPADEAALLALPGVMHAVFWARCRCDAVIHGPAPKGCDPCPCGEVHFRGDVVALADTPSGRAWVCRSCLTADSGAQDAAEPRGVTRPIPERFEAVCGDRGGQESASLFDAVPDVEPAGRADGPAGSSVHPSQHVTRQLTQPGDPLTQPPNPMTVPEPRRGDRASEGARS